jgi:hypothetical protein
MAALKKALDVGRSDNSESDKPDSRRSAVPDRRPFRGS